MGKISKRNGISQGTALEEKEVLFDKNDLWLRERK